MVLIGSYTNCTKPRLHVAVPVAFLVHFLVAGSQKLSPHSFSIILAVCGAVTERVSSLLCWHGLVQAAPHVTASLFCHLRITISCDQVHARSACISCFSTPLL